MPWNTLIHVYSVLESNSLTLTLTHRQRELDERTIYYCLQLFWRKWSTSRRRRRRRRNLHEIWQFWVIRFPTHSVWSFICDCIIQRAINGLVISSSWHSMHCVNVQQCHQLGLMQQMEFEWVENSNFTLHRLNRLHWSQVLDSLSHCLLSCNKNNSFDFNSFSPFRMIMDYRFPENDVGFSKVFQFNSGSDLNFLRFAIRLPDPNHPHRWRSQSILDSTPLLTQKRTVLLFISKHKHGWVNAFIGNWFVNFWIEASAIHSVGWKPLHCDRRMPPTIALIYATLNERIKNSLSHEIFSDLFSVLFSAANANALWCTFALVLVTIHLLA